MANIPEISLPAEPIFHLGGFPITNSVLASWIILVLLLILGVYIGTQAKLTPGRGQLIFEMLIGYFMNQLTIAYGTPERAKKYLPYILTLFLFIAFANQFSVFPLISSIITGEGTPIFRTPTSHFSLPITLALMTIVGCNLIAFSLSPLRYVGKFIKIVPIFKARTLGEFGMALLEFFTGILDIIGELAKIISMSARLFGNIISGEIMYVIIISLSLYTRFLVPIPFVFLSIASGFIQALVFSLLALNFIAGTIPSPEREATTDHQ